MYSPDNGPPFVFDTVAVPRCNEGFALNGSVARICDGETNTTGVWSGELAFCERMLLVYVGNYRISLITSRP